MSSPFDSIRGYLDKIYTGPRDQLYSYLCEITDVNVIHQIGLELFWAIEKASILPAKGIVSYDPFLLKGIDPFPSRNHPLELHNAVVNRAHEIAAYITFYANHLLVTNPCEYFFIKNKWIIENPLSELTTQHVQHDAKFLAQIVILLFRFEPLIIEEILIFVPSILFPDKDEKPDLYDHEKKLDIQLEGYYRRCTEFIDSNYRFYLECDNDRLSCIVGKPLNAKLPRIRHFPRYQIEETALKSEYLSFLNLGEAGLIDRSVMEEFEIIKTFLFPFINRHFKLNNKYAAMPGGSYLLANEFERQLLAQGPLEMGSHVKADVSEPFYYNVPYIHGIEIEELLDLRLRNEDSFEQYRCQIGQLMNSTDSESYNEFSAKNISSIAEIRSLILAQNKKSRREYLIGVTEIGIGGLCAINNIQPEKGICIAMEGMHRFVRELSSLGNPNIPTHSHYFLHMAIKDKYGR